MMSSDAPAYRENRLKRWVRTRFASDEARHDLPKSKTEERLIATRMACALLCWSLGAAFSAAEAGPVVQASCWIAMIGIVVWTALVDFASDWERERFTSQRADDKADYDKAMAAGRAVFDDICADVEERTAAIDMVNDLKRMTKADSGTFEKALRKEGLR